MNIVFYFICRLEAEQRRLLEYEQAASELDQPNDNSQSSDHDAEALISDEPVIEEPLTPAAVEDTKEDISEPTGANVEAATDDEVEPLE